MENIERFRLDRGISTRIIKDEIHRAIPYQIEERQ